MFFIPYDTIRIFHTMSDLSFFYSVCHRYHCTFMEIPMFINLSNYLTQKNKMKFIKLCRFIKSTIQRLSTPG